MTEVINLKNVAIEVSRGKKYFADFDELFSGTNVEDAFEICKTRINGLSKFDNSIFFVSTRVQKLKEARKLDTTIGTYRIDC